MYVCSTVMYQTGLHAFSVNFCRYAHIRIHTATYHVRIYIPCMHMAIMPHVHLNVHVHKQTVHSHYATGTCTMYYMFFL